MRNVKNIIAAGLFLVFLQSISGFSCAEENSLFSEENVIASVYLSGIGCSNCAVADPILFTEFTIRFPNLLIFEYEIYKEKEANRKVKKNYFFNYYPGGRGGVPFLLLGEDSYAIGRYKVPKFGETIQMLSSNDLPLSDGKKISFRNLDITSLPGAFKVWTKNRVLISGSKGRNKTLKGLLLAQDVPTALENVDFEKIDPKPVEISGSEIDFKYAVKIGDWILQWNGEPAKASKASKGLGEKGMVLLLLSVIFLFISFSMLKVTKRKKGMPVGFELKAKMRDVLVIFFSFFALIAFFVLAKNISPDFLEESGYKMPLGVFTFLIALVDGFNPCNMFVLTCLLALLIATSDSRARLFVVAFSFIGMVFIFYFMFMAAWLNVFKYISFIKPLRITIGSAALIAGIINCKELLFFRKGFSLMIQDKHKGPLMKKVDQMKEIIKSGSYPLLISSSIALAALASLIELPCTAGFPIIYTGVLSGRGLDSTVYYYLYLVLYNLVYIIPLLVIVVILIYTFRVRTITQRHMEIIKFVGGAIMILLGIILLVNPGLVGIGM